MAETKPQNSLDQSDQKILEYLKHNNVETKLDTNSNFTKPKNSKQLAGILEQRKKQRSIMLYCIICLAFISLLTLLGLSVFQAVTRVYIHNYTIFTSNEFQLLTIGVFGEILGVVWIITKELWDDSKYLPSMDK